MAGRLLRCKRCWQPVLSDARCCPHCAVSQPIRRRRIGQALLAMLLVVAVAAWLNHANGARIAGGMASFVETATTTLQGALPNSVFGQPDAFAAACSARGGTVVEMRGTDRSPVRRCATSFDDSLR